MKKSYGSKLDSSVGKGTAEKRERIGTAGALGG